MKQKGKGFLIAMIVVLVFGLLFLITGEYAAFGGSLIWAGLFYALYRRKQKKPQAEPAASEQPAAEHFTPKQNVESVVDGVKIISGEYGRMTVQDTVSHVLFVPVKNRKILSIESSLCPCGCSFGSWNEKVHRGVSQSDRFEKAQHQCIGLLDFNVDTGFAKISGSKGSEYLTSLDFCSCPDFEKRSKPCKHIYFLAIQMGYSDSEFYSC